MKKIYDKKICQYSLDGKLLNVFDDRYKAATHVNSHPDSVISCCIGKYKTSGGFVFRFEGEPFNINKKIPTNNNTITCKICNSPETLRSFANHLRWVHSNYKTEDYIKKYGEFRPKFIKQNENKKQSNTKCELCGEKMMHNRQLMYHLTKKHKDITKEEYVVKYIYGNNPPLCKCGCGEEVTLLFNGKNCDLDKETYNRDYIKGHWDWPVFSNISHQSNEELKLLEFIKSIYSGEIIENAKNIIPNSEIDIFLPQLKIGIEYNGLYWHSEKAGRGKYYHLNKTLGAKKQNIRLIHIFSDELNNNENIVKNKLKSIIGLNTDKIYARKCVVKEVTNIKEKNDFLNKNHIQGKDKSKIKLGLYYNDELVSIMTFCHPRIALGGKPTTKKWELSRYATSIQVVGGASKLLKHFINYYNPQEIYSYSDNRWSDWDNNMYIKLGFKFVNRTSPGYYYTKNFTERIHRFNFRKSKLKQKGINIEGKTEHEIMDSLKYYKVWDCGVAKFEWKKEE
jgi:hypothetical protein